MRKKSKERICKYCNTKMTKNIDKEYICYLCLHKEKQKKLTEYIT